jgi:hypothetical protein
MQVQRFFYSCVVICEFSAGGERILICERASLLPGALAAAQSSLLDLDAVFSVPNSGYHSGLWFGA